VIAAQPRVPQLKFRVAKQFSQVSARRIKTIFINEISPFWVCFWQLINVRRTRLAQHSFPSDRLGTAIGTEQELRRISARAR
jgi:hypothetical protein